MRIAHISDLHMLSLDGVGPRRFLNKRITGYVNYRLRRGSVHRPAAVRAIARELRRLEVEHVVITGDVSNLALEGEFELVREVVERELAIPRERVSMVPGNHDAYTRGAHRSQRFARYFEPYLRSDLPELAAGGELGPFPFVHLRGEVALVGLCSAWPRPPLVASGKLGAAQLAALERILAHPEVARRTLVLLQHHPWHNPPDRAHVLLEGLVDAVAEGRLLRNVRRGLLLHGHLHRRIHRRLATDAGHVDAVGATSASLMHPDDARMAGFNLYEIGSSGEVGAIRSFRLEPEDQGFREVPVPRG